eukprot:scaffold9100_cov91-Isochrysis_galbana.AAC.2
MCGREHKKKEGQDVKKSPEQASSATHTDCVRGVAESCQVLRQERVGQVEPEGCPLQEGHVYAGVDDVPARQDGGARRAAYLRRARRRQQSRSSGGRHAWKCAGCARGMSRARVQTVSAAKELCAVGAAWRTGCAW